MQYLRLFRESYIDSTPRTGIVIQRDLPFLRKQYGLNVEKIQQYYLSRNYAVKNTHILSRLVQLFPYMSGYDDYEYLELIQTRLTYLAKHFRFTSDLEQGIVHAPYFYGNYGEEVILSSFEHFDISEVKKNWKTANCIDVLKHPRNGSKLMLPLGRVDEERGGMSVISINIPMLALKYREFEREQYLNSKTDGQVLTKNHFVIKHVLPFMMEDTIDHIFLNRLMDKYYDRGIVDSPYKHKFPVFEPLKQVDRWVDDTLDVLSSKRIEFANMLRNIKLMFVEDAGELLTFSGFGWTRQSKWAAIAARIDYMIFLLDIAESNGNLDYNRHHLNDWKRLAIRFKNDRFMKQEFSVELGDDIESKLERLRDL